MINYDFIFHTFLACLMAIFINLSLIYIHKKYFLKKKISPQIQDIHYGNISRLGGLSLVISFILFILYQSNTILIYAYISSLICLSVALLEDLTIKIKPLIRLIFIFISSFSLIFLIEYLPVFDLPYFREIFNNQYLRFIFFSIGIATLINGQNIIDGAHGLSAFSAISSLSCIMYIGLIKSDPYIFQFSIFMIVLCLIFLLFNYPFGKIFLGDTGSYFIGFIIGYLVIHTYGLYEDIPTWSALIIIYYPILEVVFSYFRKIYEGKSPFNADDKHLHLKMYRLISKNNSNSNLFNALVSPFMSPVWLTPIAIFPITLHFGKVSFLGVVVITAIYLFYYYAIPYIKKN